jgi:hypothetical protein
MVLAAMQSGAGIAAGILGLLYLVGIGIETRELQHADLSVRDVLPLFPLEQILRSSLVIVWPALAFLCVLAVSLAASLRYEDWLRRLSLEFVAEELKNRPTDDGLLEAQRHAEKRGDWSKVKREVKRATNRAQGGDHDDRLPQLIRLRRALIGWDLLGSILLFVLLPVVFLFLPAAIAIACGILFYLSLFFAMAHPAPAVYHLLALYLVFVGGAIAFALIYPRPFPNVTVEPNGTSGQLIVVSDGTWYLATGCGRIEAVPAAHVVAAQIDPQPRQETVWQKIFGVSEDFAPPRHSDAPSCAP